MVWWWCFENNIVQTQNICSLHQKCMPDFLIKTDERCGWNTEASLVTIRTFKIYSGWFSISHSSTQWLLKSYQRWLAYFFNIFFSPVPCWRQKQNLGKQNRQSHLHFFLTSSGTIAKLTVPPPFLPNFIWKQWLTHLCPQSHFCDAVFVMIAIQLSTILC